MHSFTATILAASAIFSAASAGPIVARQVCGAAPAGAVAQTPLSQPSGITTASSCATQCKANTSCKSFLFGLSNGADKCMLFSVAASSVPAQTGLVAYDIACTSIPSVVPTTANPGGLASSNSGTTGNGNGNAGSNAGTAGNTNAGTQGGAQPRRRQQQGGATGGAAAGGATSGGATNNNNNGGAVTGQTGANNNGGAATGNQGTHASPMNAAPAGNPNPISTPAASSLATCLAACKSNAACVAYTFLSGTCKLFA
ncbi:hypothetical protein DL95DRAFT_484349 [Leptodontidium sp. 2 PMI_412]|nr:hypothetical protein BKA61DRAFT_579976 [Leptodontidium sp. MPI-SDFR-AT-0119]KAH9207022.1 hypothetical protein DL95DRAFT_484349 [Leptodontidium sp. 2 PMI_412]